MTDIEWTHRHGTRGEVWNPSTGCDRISPGCDGCYALTMARRLKGMGSAKYQTDGDPRTSGPGFGVAVHPDLLDLPYRWRKPRTVFVNSMSDLFHARVPVEFIRQVFAVMATTPQHTYQILTKRASRLASLAPSLHWPSNVWMGVSVENAAQLHRVDDLRTVPAAVRFISAEPLLGPLDGLDLDGLDWVIVGGESGPKARPMNPAWPRMLRDQCISASVPYFFKQWGEWVDLGEALDWGLRPGGEIRAYPGGMLVKRVGKRAAGRRLDGRTWDEYPAPRAVGAVAA